MLIHMIVSKYFIINVYGNVYFYTHTHAHTHFSGFILIDPTIPRFNEKICNDDR